MKTVSLSGSPRESVGKKGAASLRTEDKIPAVIYGGKEQIHFSIFEIFCKRISNNNMIFASFISFMICFRIFNFGYVPRDTYLFIISVLLSVLMIFFLSRFNFFSSRRKIFYRLL